MSYNMSGFSNSTNLYEMFAAVNVASDNWLVYMALIGVFVILLINLLRNNPPPEAFTASSAVCSILSLAFLLADVINVVWVVGFAFIFALSAVSLYLSNKAS